MKTMTKDLTQGSVKTHYFKYLGAAFGSSLISCIYGMVDAAVVGQYQGPQGAAALSIVLPIWTILYSLGLLIGVGGSVNYSYYKAQGKKEKANAYFTLSLILIALVSAVCWIGMNVFDDQLLRLFGADDSLLLLAKEYLKPVQCVIPAFPLTQFLAAFLRNDNDPGRATLATLLGGVFNVVGDFFFVFGLNMGMAGAGLATAIGAAISVFIMLTHFISAKNSISLTRVYGQVHKARLLTGNGFSTFIIDVSMGIITMLFNRQVMHFLGTDALAVYGVIAQIMTIVQSTTYSAGQASQPIITENYGIGDWDRIEEAKKYALCTVAFLAAFWTGFCVLFPNTSINIFMAPTEPVLLIAPPIIRVYGLSFLMLPLNIFAAYYFPSIMRPGTAFVVSISRGLLLSPLLILVLPAIFGGDAIWWVMPITEFLTAAYVIKNLKSRK